MASLKEVKDRIDSVKSTKQITSAMKMIASSKLRRAQSTITSFLPYSIKLNDILIDLLASDNSFDSPYSQKRETQKVAFVVFTSNSNLCGAFNTNVLKEFYLKYVDFRKTINTESIVVYPIGKKALDFVKKQNIAHVDNPNFIEMADKQSFPQVLELSKELVARFLSRDLDKIILVYTHFQSAGTQLVTSSEYLPFDLKSVQEKAKEDNDSDKTTSTEYLLEPTREKLIEDLIPKVLASNLHATLLDSVASEHASRNLAMQIATDNATNLVDELTIEYNKSRQTAITNELLDIIGGAAALG